MPSASQFCWAWPQSPLLPTSLPHWLRAPGPRHAIAIVSMPHSARGCASCRSTKTGGGQDPVIRRTQFYFYRVRQLPIRARTKQIAQKKFGISSRDRPVRHPVLLGFRNLVPRIHGKQLEISEGVFPVEAPPFEIHVKFGTRGQPELKIVFG